MKNLMLLVVSLCLLILSCEIVIRYGKKAWPFSRPLYLQEYLTARDATLRWRFPPTEGRNSLGLQNREIAKKKAGVHRVLFLGDSLVCWSQTSSGKYYTEVLELRLNARFQDDSHSYEIINAGIPGYTTYQELEFLKTYGFDMEPDRVILGFVFNDLHYKYLHRLTKHGLLAPDPAQFLHHFDTRSFPGSIFAQSYLAHEIVKRIKIIRGIILQEPVFPFEQREDFYIAWKDYGWLHVQELIGEMQDLLTAKEIPFSIVVFPMSDQVNDKYRSIDKEFVLYPQKMIRKICNQYEIPLLDLTEALYINGGVELFKDYLHLNEKGNDVVADTLEQYITHEIIASLDEQDTSFVTSVSAPRFQSPAHYR